MKIFLMIVGILILVLVHAFIGMYIDKLKFLKGESRTNWELIPFANVYLLGKHTFNRVVGIILFILLFFVVDWTITLFGSRYGFMLFNDNFRHLLFVLYFIVIVVVFICAAVRYNSLTDNKDRFKFVDLIYYLKETLCILVLLIAIYLFILFVRSASI